jgi:sulfonate transport system substrate-binding protein
MSRSQFVKAVYLSRRVAASGVFTLPSIKIILSSVLLSFAVTLSAKAEDLPKVIRFAEVGVPTHGKPYGIGLVPLAVQQGLFEREFGKDGPKIEINYYVGTGPAINEAIAENEADFGTYGGLPALIGLSGGVPAHVVLARRSSTASSYVFAVHPDAPFKTVADLKGARIAVQKGTNPYMTLVQILEAAHLSENDVNIVNLQGPSAVAAFESGSVDALFSGSSLLILRNRGAVRLIQAPRNKIEQETSIGAILVGSDFEKSYPQTVARVVKVLVQICYWASQETNHDTVISYLANVGYGREITKEEYAGSLKDRFNPTLNGGIKSGFQEISQFAVAHKLVRQAPDLSGWYESKYVDAAYKDLHLQDYWKNIP